MYVSKLLTGSVYDNGLRLKEITTAVLVKYCDILEKLA